MKNKLEFFGLSDEPFRLTPDTNYFYPSLSHKEALKLLAFSLENGDGFALLTGAPGMGKTTLIKKFIENLPDNWQSVVIVSPMLSPDDLIKAVLNDIGIETASSEASKNLILLQDYLLNLAKSNKKLLLIIDEAQSLPIDSLEQIRLLSNIETKDAKPLQIILSGQPELEKMVKNQIRQLNQRITVRCALKPFNKEETDRYIKFRMAKAGGSINITKFAQFKLRRYSRGIPRVINSIMKRSLTIAYSDSRKNIAGSDITSAADSLGLNKKRNLNFLIILVCFVIFMIVLLEWKQIYSILR